MRLFTRLALLLLAVSCASAQFNLGGGGLSFIRKRAVRAEMFLSHEAAKPGDTVWAAIKLTHNPGWHTYWKFPGDSGTATTIHWALTNGITTGEIEWPVPEKYTDPTVGLITYVYHNVATLLVPLTIGTDAPTGTNDLRALVKWLECEVQCVPGSNMVSAPLVIGTETKLAADTNLFTEARQRLPSKQLPGTATARWDSHSDSVRPLVISWNTAATDADFFPFTNALAVISNKTEISTSADGVILRKQARTRSGEWPAEIAGLLVRKENGVLAGYEVSLPLSGGGKGIAPAASATDSKPLALWLLYAFIGGLILNIMPCVLPVIALKVLGFVNQNRDQPGEVRKLGLIYTLGIVTSFLVFAGIVIALKAAGQKVGWGMQFGNAQFVVGMTVLMTLVALNLFGVFEVGLGGGTMAAASQAASRHGSAGAFMNGVLAVILATPCMAPFMAAALGFAFAQPPYIIVACLTAVALGLAAPFVLLSWNPAWLKLLPRPGVWMERFKVSMGFPMIATAVWLFTMTDRFYGDRVWWLGVFLVVLALAAWVYGEFVQRGRTRRTAAVLIALALLAGGYAYALEHKLNWRKPAAEQVTAGSALKHAPAGYAWERWSNERVAAARAEGRPVVVDFTAEWCITCNTVVKPAFESDAVIAKLKELNAVALVADYTSFAPEITAELEKHGRAGVPMILVYSAEPTRPAVVVPEAILPSTQAKHILAALEKAKN